MLTEAGRLVFDLKEANVHAGRSAAIREFHLKSGHGDANYLFYVDGQAVGVVERIPGGQATF